MTKHTHIGKCKKKKKKKDGRRGIGERHKQRGEKKLKAIREYFCFSLLFKMREITMDGRENDPIEKEILMTQERKGVSLRGKK